MSTLLSMGTPIPVIPTPDPNIISIKCLSLRTRNLISTLLNPTKVIPTDGGLPRDWRGLAHLAGLKTEKIPVIACDTDPSARVLTLWQKQQDVPCTINKFIEFLEELDRFDIIDDATDAIEEDMKVYIETPIVEEERCTTPDNDSEKQILTSDDLALVHQGLGIQNYDAYVVFADEDIDFATELIEKMERNYGFKLFVRERDLIAGLPFEYKALIKVISERCNRLIVILSPAYLKSSVNKFVVHYAQALGIEQGRRKIIPCIYEKCEPPQELRHYFMLNYSRSGRLFNFWDKLRDSIQARPATPRNRRVGMQEENVRISETDQQLPVVEPVLVQSTPKHVPNNVRPRKEGNLSVKFGSLTNLSSPETEENRKVASTNTLYTSPSYSSSPHLAESQGKKHKNWLNWFKWIQQKTQKDKESKDKEKKSRFKSKTKVPQMS